MIAAVVLLSLFLFACGEPALGPSDTVREFAQAMAPTRAPDALRRAYGLLDAKAQAALGERAQQATTLAGRDFEPWQMLARGRFRPRFSHAPVGGLRERIDGDRAVVIVTGKQPGQRAEIPLVREQGQWRIKLALPPPRAFEPAAADTPEAERDPAGGAQARDSD